MPRNTKVILGSILALFSVQLISAQSRCSNPNRRSGVCVSIYDCPPLLGVISQKPLSVDDRKFLLASQCSTGSGALPHVCCNEDRGYSSTPKTSPVPISGRRFQVVPSNGRGNVLPSPPGCGRDTTGNRIYGGNLTELDEFPWMALLVYRSAAGTSSLNCGGSLINQRYVLTAAHCVVGEILTEIGPLHSIRLGEYDISKDVDCIARDCAEPALELGFEDITVHENFNPNLIHRHHDIALIRLNQDVTYNDFIHPVCMPSSLSFQKSLPGSNVVVAGWGRTLRASQSLVKQKLTIPVADQMDCKRKFATKKVNVIESQLCAGGVFTEDTCDGDSGGPLMRFVRTNWVLEGIISFGNRCGLQDWPAVYTRVSSYESWIKRKIRP